MKRFVIRKTEQTRLGDLPDVDGVIAEGIEFSDGLVVIHRCIFIRNTGIFESIDDYIQTHGNEVDMRIEWIDE